MCKWILKKDTEEFSLTDKHHIQGDKCSKFMLQNIYVYKKNASPNSDDLISSGADFTNVANQEQLTVLVSL